MPSENKENPNVEWKVCSSTKEGRTIVLPFTEDKKPKHSANGVKPTNGITLPNEDNVRPKRPTLTRQETRNVNPEDTSDNTAIKIRRVLQEEVLDPLEEGGKPECEATIPLAFEKFRDWFHILRFDDYQTYDKVFDGLEEDQKDILLSGFFLYNQPPKQLRIKTEDRMSEFCIPLNIALASRANLVCQRMLDDYADLYKHDIGRANVFHVLIIAASEKRHHEEKYLKLLSLVMKYIPSSEVRRLLLEENTDGYRPLELAARLGVFGLFNEILNCDGHLVERSFEAGLNTYSVYNLTDYEDLKSKRRFLRSPLRLIGYTKPEMYDSLKKYGTVNLQVIKRWYHLTFKRNLGVLLMWWALRVAFNSMMIFLDFTVILKSQCHAVAIEATFAKNCLKIEQMSYVSENAAYFAVFWALMIAFLDIAEVIIVIVDKERRLAYKGITWTDFLAWTPFYRICQFLQVSLTVIAPLSAVIVSGNSAFTCLLIIKALSLPLVMMSILYILEPVPKLGGFAIALQKMIESIIAFMIFFIPVLITFAVFFQLVAPISAGFSGMAASLYRLFMLEIGTFDFGEDPSIVITIVHITYYLMTGILLMNYLIAVMTSVINDTDEDREIMHFLRRLNLIMLAQERYGQWTWKLWYKYRGYKSIRVYAEEDES